MSIAYIGLGSNLGDCSGNILRAWKKLGKIKEVELLDISSPYSSAPVGMDSEHWFINAVGRLQTSLEPVELLQAMLAVEEDLGRKRGDGNGPEDRTVDLDLLYWGNRISDDPEVVLPHPKIAERLFVLQPLAEIGPDLCHPVTGKTSVEMLQDLLARLQASGDDQQVNRTVWPKGGSEVSK